MKTIQIINEGEICTLEIVRESAKAFLLRGKCSEAWFPKSAIESDGTIADWFEGRMTLTHGFCLMEPIK